MKWGLGKNPSSFLTIVLAAIMSFAVLNVGSVFAAHTATITITPDVANCDELGNTFTVNVENDAGSTDKILQVEIYKALAGISDFECGSAPTGWTLFSYEDRCIYVTGLQSIYKIAPGANVDFTFDATMSSDACASEFIVVTVDDHSPIGTRNTYPVQVQIDCTPPVIEKLVGDPKIPGSGFDWWVTEKTLITLSASDDADKCDLGVDYCRYQITVDGVPGGWIIEDNGPELSWKFYFDEDSEHYLEVECYDNAGNKATLTETDKVDDTPPETAKEYGDPSFPADINSGGAYPHWITTSTPIWLTPVDPEADTTPDGVDCSIGVEKTWYYDVLVPDDVCSSEGRCAEYNLDCPTPYEPCPDCGDGNPNGMECVNNAQEMCENIEAVCDKYWEHLGYYNYSDCIDSLPTWEDCVEKVVNDPVPGDYEGSGIGCVSCACDSNWQLYRGTPIFKDEESCHLLQFFSVDYLGNIEDVHRQCVYVEDQPPVGEKEIGDPKVGGCREDIKPELCESWGCLEGLNKDFFVTGRYGDNNPTAGAWELAIWENTTSGESVKAQDNYGWTSGAEVDFSLSYDPSDGKVTYTVDGKTLEWTYATGKAFTYIIPFAKGNADGNSVELTGMELNGMAIPNVISGSGYMGLRIYLSDQDQMNGFTITGKAKLAWGTPKNEIPGFHIFAMDTHDWEDCWVRDHVTEITLDCVDPEPHPVDHEELCYRVSFDGDPAWLTPDYCAEFGGWMDDEGKGNIDAFCCADVSGEKNYKFTFMEDSLHDLEYYCEDALGNMNEVDIEWFRVDSQPPVIEKNMFGSYLGDCPSGTDIEHGDCYVADDGTSGVDIIVYDDQTYLECAVDNVRCEYKVLWETSEVMCGDRPYEAGWCLVEGGKFTDTAHIIFNEDSTHKLIIYCEDELGNSVDDEEEFLVDSKPPETTKTYGDPYKVDPECGAWCGRMCEDDGIIEDCMDFCTHYFCTMWITSDTEITLEAEDEKVGVDKIYWRNLYFPDNDEICYRGEAVLERPAIVVDGMFDKCHPEYYSGKIDGYVDIPFNEYSGPFKKSEDSCHVIEYYAVDKLGNEEQLKWQCVFVDNTAPEGIKEVGKPSIFVGEGGDAEEPIPEGSGSVDPATVDVELDPGESVVITKEVTTGEVAAAAPEIYLLADTTGSMSGVISTVKSDMVSILASIEAKFGAGDYKDFPSDPYAFNNGQSITSDDSLVTAAISAMAASGGADGSEGQLYALHKIAQNAVGYSTDSTKIVVWFGDAPGHDPVCNAINGGEGDLTEASVTSELASAGIIVIAISTTTGYYDGLDDDPSSSAYDYSGYCSIDGTAGQASRIAAATGGIHLTDVSSGEIVAAIIDAIGIVTGTTDVVPDASDCIAKGLEVTFDPTVHEDVGPLTMVTFEETITLPGDATPGTIINCDVRFRSGELGGIIATERIYVNGRITGGGFDWWVRDHVTPITLSCDDSWEGTVPHPVYQETMCYRVSFDDPDKPWLTKDYCEEFGGAMEGDWCCNYLGGESYTLYFEEDSLHDLEFYCTDHLGNEGKKDIEWFKVDSIPPVTTKTYIPEAYIDPASGWEYIDTAHEIELTAVDGGDVCAVGVDEIQYRVSGALADKFCQNCEDWMTSLRPDMGDWITYTGPFGIADESCHVIEYRSIDLLENTEDIKWQCVFVDKTPPAITKEYGSPYFSEAGIEWISSTTPIKVKVNDPEPHPSGVNDVQYRVTLLGSNDPCMNKEACEEADGSGSWVSGSEEFSFTIPDDSCHLIEITATDNVGKTSEHKQCVFVDNQAPYPDKTVEDPKSRWDGKDANFYDIEDICRANDEPDSCPAGTGCIDCWKITLDTEIKLECIDPEPHPVDHNGVCFKVDVDGSDFTKKYCCDPWTKECEYYDEDTGYCCLPYEETEFKFREETEHNLKYYCADALGNTGPVDEEKFKVGGTKFEIPLCKKWNLVSVPFVLLDDDPDAVFDQTPGVQSVWAYDGESGEWLVYTPDGDAPDTLTSIEPGWGYWVLETDGCEELVLGGSLFNTLAIPPSRDLVKGWNLIGYYGTTPKDEAYCALNSLIDTQEGFPRWSSLWSYSNKNCKLCDGMGCGGIWGWYGWTGLDVCDKMTPGRGYWIEIDVEDKYAPASVCIWNKDFPELECVKDWGWVF